MRLTEIWRYPIKSMAGELLSRAMVSSLGIGGDRVVHVEDARGHLVTARSHPRLLGHQGTLGADAEPLVDGRPWRSLGVEADVADIAGPGATLVRDDSAGRFDVLPLLVATDGAVAAFGRDRRRLRPNLLIAGVEGLSEREWPGGRLAIGQTIIGVRNLRSRCVMTAHDPDTLDTDKDVTRDIYRRFDGKLALDCFVIAGGEIAVGDEVSFEQNQGI